MGILHERENNQDTEDFLKSNGKKFVGDCLIAMKLMYQGVVLSSQDCWVKYGFHDRRLRNCRTARPDIVKSKWELKPNGSRSHVVYWIERPKVYPTKAELNKWFSEYQNEKPPLTTSNHDPIENRFTQLEMFK